MSILYSAILVYLPELPSYLPLTGLIRLRYFVLIPSLLGKALRDLDGECLSSFHGDVGRVVIWSLMEAHHSLWSPTFHRFHTPWVSHCESKKYHGPSRAMSSRNVYKGKITRAQICYLGNTVIICVWIILVLEKNRWFSPRISQTKCFGNRQFLSCFKKYVNNQKLITGCFPLGSY